VEANNKQGSRENHSRWRISSLLQRKSMPGSDSLCPVASGARAKVGTGPMGCCTGWPLSHLVAPGTNVTVLSWCPLQAWGGLVCFSLEADFSGSAAAEAGSSNSIVSAPLCL